MHSHESWIQEGCSAQAIGRFFRENRAQGNDIYTLQIARGEEVLVRVAAHPHSNLDRSELYSLSKSFASTAIGLAVEEGLVSLEDRVVDLFAKECPGVISKNLAAMRVRHLLSMNTGHDECALRPIKESRNLVADFLALPVPYEPGTHFTYNSGASFMLSAIITQCSGQSLLDYLLPRLFLPLDIQQPQWDKWGGPLCMGGVGLHLNTDELVRLGMLYSSGGVYKNRRILPEKWVEEATRIHSDNSANGTPDWSSGYGFQFWMNAQEGYRGDGAFGQLCMVLPRSGLVVALRAEVADMQKEVELVMDLVHHLHQPAPQGEFQFCYSPLSGGSPQPWERQGYVCRPNAFAVTRLVVAEEEDRVEILWSDGEKVQRLCAGKGKWLENRLETQYLTPMLCDLMPAHQRRTLHFVASCHCRPGQIQMEWRCLNVPHTLKVTLTAQPQGLQMEIGARSDNLLAAEARCLWADVE